MATRKLTAFPIGCILDSFGNHPGAWLDPRIAKDCSTDIEHYLHIAKIAEDAGLDFLFVADSPALPEGDLDQISRSPKSVNRFEPVTLLSALASNTHRIGLVATASTSYNDPYSLARQFASLDHISKGRIGWNIVTTENSNAWANYGNSGQDSHGNRYDRANEFVDVVRGLWDSWDDDAFIFNQADHRYFDPKRVHELNHTGHYFSVRGPLNISRPPQGYPVLVQAGGSPAGRELSGRVADVVFTVQPDIESARTSYAQTKTELSRFGRTADELRVMLGVTVVVGDTIKEVEEKIDQLGSWIHEEAGRAMVERILEADLSSVGYDSQVPESLLPSNSNRNTTYFLAVKQLITHERLTLRQISARLSLSRIGQAFKGTPAQIVDEMTHWISQGACDGFMLRPTDFPNNLSDFCSKVLPELEHRGLYNSKKPICTFREALGLKRPASRRS